LFHFLKKKMFLALGASLFLFSGVIVASNVEVYKDPNPPFERPADMPRENILIDPTKRVIENIFGSLPNLEQYGVIRFENNPDKVVVGFKETNEKTKAFIFALKQNIPSEALEIRDLQYSTDDLVNILKDVTAYLNEHGINYFGLVLGEEQKVRIEVEQLSKEHQNILKNKFGDVLEIQINKVQNQEYIERQRSWNNLGGGIGILLPEVDSTTYCLTAGVGQKGSNWYLVTAGHCIIKNDKYGYQYNNIVGLDHHDARVSGLDAGLIQITNDNNLAYGRYATNDFYLHAENLDYYDAEISGYGWSVEGETLGKSGVRTGVTYGVVKSNNATWNSEDGVYQMWG
jgi:hypothetical protein